MSSKLLHGDSRELLRGVTVDTIITDPVWPNCRGGLLQGWDDPFGLLAETLSVIDAKRLVIILRNDSDPRFLAAVPSRWPFFRCQILPYVMPGYYGRKLGGDELAYCFGEPVPSVPGKRVIPGYAPKAQPKDRVPNGHPCSRALIHMEWLVNWWSLPGETVCDPFMGSGQVGVACARRQRNFIGCEIEAEYFNLAQHRIGEEMSRPLLVQLTE